MFKCNKCNKEFQSKYRLNRHLQKKIPCTRHKNQCHICGKILSSQQSLYVHKKKCKKKLNEVSDKYPESIQEAIKKDETIKIINNPEEPKIIISDGPISYKKTENISINEGDISKKDGDDYIGREKQKMGTFINLDEYYNPIPRKRRTRRQKPKTQIKTEFFCELCGSKFTRANNMYRHKKFRCKNRTKQEYVYQNHVIFNEEKRRSYGDENLDWIKDSLTDIADRIKHCESIADFVNLGFWSIHCNNKFLENQNVRIKSKKDFFDRNIISVYSDCEWKLEDTKKVVEQSSRKFVDSLDSAIYLKGEKMDAKKNINDLLFLQTMIEKFDEADVKNNQIVEAIKPNMYIMMENLKERIDKKDNDSI